MADSPMERARRLILRSQQTTELLQKVHFHLTHFTGEPPIVVHQMARVGSITVLHAVLERFPRSRVFHTHYLNPATIAQQRAAFDERYRASGEAGLHREFLAALHLTRRLQRGITRKWRVITMVRDPVARTVSAFFKHFALWYPALPKTFHQNPDNVPRLIELFLDKGEHERRVALEWFDREVADVLGIDVFSAPFSTEAGSATYESATCDMLLLRTEDMDRRGAGALSHFLSQEGMSLTTKNRGREQSYGSAYERFLARIDFPAWYLDEMYESRLARHFYSDAELTELRRRWQRV